MNQMPVEQRLKEALDAYAQSTKPGSLRSDALPQGRSRWQSNITPALVGTVAAGVILFTAAVSQQVLNSTSSRTTGSEAQHGAGDGSLEASPSVLTPAATTGPPAKLLSTGECAGITLSAEVPQQLTHWRISPGSASNLLQMPSNSLRYLRVTGPCQDRLRYRVTGDLLQSLNGKPVGHFIAGLAGIVSKDFGKSGEATVNVYLEGTPSTELALITVQIIGRPPSATIEPTVVAS